MVWDIFVSLWSWDLVHENCADVAVTSVSVVLAVLLLTDVVAGHGRRAPYLAMGGGGGGGGGGRPNTASHHLHRQFPMLRLMHDLSQTLNWRSQQAETGNITDGDGESMECLLQLPAYGFGYRAQHRGHQHGPSRYGTNIGVKHGPNNHPHPRNVTLQQLALFTHVYEQYSCRSTSRAWLAEIANGRTPDGLKLGYCPGETLFQSGISAGWCQLQFPELIRRLNTGACPVARTRCPIFMCPLPIVVYDSIWSSESRPGTMASFASQRTRFRRAPSLKPLDPHHPRRVAERLHYTSTSHVPNCSRKWKIAITRLLLSNTTVGSFLEHSHYTPLR
ncbi:hypothetical protein WG66_005596 [Moniliophthora roreri]|nr:hypothetical protein WG66_005596 [Moniliophthora roreri]